MPKMSECTKPHALVHTVVGLGLGLLFAAIFPAVYAWGATLALVVIVIGLVGEFVWNK